MGYADARATSVKIAAKSFPTVPRFPPSTGPGALALIPRPLPIRSLDAYLVGLRLENEIHGLRFAASDGHILRLLAVGLMPGGNRVFSRWQVRQSETPSLASDRETRSLQHDKCAVHPWVDVALHRYELWLVKLFGKRQSPGRLRLIPFMIDLRQGVNVVRCMISVYEFKFMVEHHGNDKRQILAPLLRDGDRLRGCRGLIRRAGRDINNHILQGVPRTHDHRFRWNRSRMLLCTARLLGHVDRFLFGGGTFVGYFAGDAAAARPREGNRRSSEHDQHSGIAYLGWHNLYSFLR